MFLQQKKIVLIVITKCLLFPLIGHTQALDSIIHLPEVIIQDSSLKNNLPVIFIANNSFELNVSGDLGEILKKESNVNGIRRGGFAVDPVIRGYRNSQVNIYLDEGIHIEGGCPNRMDPVISHVEPELVRYIQVIKGPYSMKYGPSSSSSIRIITRPDESSFNKGYGVNALSGYDAIRNGFRQHVELSRSTKKSVIIISGGLKKAGNYKDGNGNEWLSSYTKKYISTDFGYKINSSKYLMLSYKGVFANDVSFPALPMDEDKDKTHIISGFYQSKNAEKRNVLTMSAYHSNVYHLMDNSLRPQSSQVISPYKGIMQASALVKTTSTGGRISIEYPLYKIILKQGIDARVTMKNGTRNILMIMEMEGEKYTSSRAFNLWNNALMFNTGVFTELNYRQGNLDFGGIIRMDYNFSNSNDTLIILKNNIEYFNVKPSRKLLPSLSFQSSYKLNQTNTLGISIARSQRAADISERYIKFLATGYDNYDYLGNPALQPETSTQLDILYNYKKNKFQFNINLFTSRISNFISGKYLPPSIAKPLTMGAPGVKQFNNLPEAYFKGFEATFEYSPTDQLILSINSGYTYAYIHELEKIIITNNQPSGIELLQNDPLSEMPAWDTRLQASYRFKKPNLKIDLSVTAVQSQNLVSKAFYEEKTPGYVLSDLSFSYAPSKIISIASGFNNIFNVAYYDHLNRKILGSTMKLYEPGRSFFMMLKIKVNKHNDNN